MVKLFLKAKHWQLFLVLLGIPIIFQVFMLFEMFLAHKTQSIPDPKHMMVFFKFFPPIMILFTGLFFGWFWSIAIGLKEKIPREIKLKTNKFKFFFFFPLFYIMLLILHMAAKFYGLTPNTFNTGNWTIALILPVHLFSMFCIFYSMYFVAKTIKTVELQKKVRFGDFAGEFFLLWFYIIGIWIIQPKINRLVDYKNITQQPTSPPHTQSQFSH